MVRVGGVIDIVMEISGLGRKRGGAVVMSCISFA